MDSLTSGTMAGTGSFRCEGCGFVLTLAERGMLSDCPSCGGKSFSRSSLFSSPRFSRTAQRTPEEQASWLEQARESLEEPGQYLAYEDGEETVVVALKHEWTRVGRSLAADVRFDDPTVSRRHALIVRQADGVRVLDDRSLNGVFVNGARVEWSALADGDEIVVGRYCLHYLESSSTLAGTAAACASEPDEATG
jgi:predicted  nucleic acid-binding Zn-ribbon protein